MFLLYHVFTPPPIDERSTVMSLSVYVFVCVCVCLFTILSLDYTSDLHQIFCACNLWLWLDPVLAV